MELKETITLMCSANYQDRFKAECYQLQIRHDKLKDIVDNWDNLDFEPICPKFLLEEQLEAMEHLLDVYEHRSEIEEVEVW